MVLVFATFGYNHLVLCGGCGLIDGVCGIRGTKDNTADDQRTTSYLGTCRTRLAHSSMS